MGVAVPSDVEPILVVLLLGIVTDYSVFFLAGMRRRLLEGEGSVDAALHATALNLPIVVTAGLIVACGAAALLAGRLEFFRAFGPGMALTVLVGLAVSITLVPALLAIVGRGLFWPSLGPAPAGAGEPGRERTRRTDSWSDSLAEFATSKLVALVVAAVSLGLVALASKGPPRPSSASRRSTASLRRRGAVAAEAAGQGFAPGILAPTVLVVEQRAGRPTSRPWAGSSVPWRRSPASRGSSGPATSSRTTSPAWSSPSKLRPCAT